MFRMSIAVALATVAIAGCGTPGPQELPLREALHALSPIAYEALQRIELRSGARYSDAQITQVTGSDEFAREYAQLLSAFCGDRANTDNLACARRATQ